MQNLVSGVGLHRSPSVSFIIYNFTLFISVDRQYIMLPLITISVLLWWVFNYDLNNITVYMYTILHQREQFRFDIWRLTKHVTRVCEAHLIHSFGIFRDL